MNSENSYTEIIRENVGHVDVITINRPEAKNALTHTTYRELADAVETSAARCIVITGADTAFCSGDDVKQVMAAAGERASRGHSESSGSSSAEPVIAPRLTPAAGVLLRTDIPVIAAVNGAAVGWGMELALMADIRVASEKARFGELFVKRGLCSDVAGLARLAQLVGREHAAELLFTGRIIDAAEALSMRLVSRVVPHDDLMTSALDIASGIAANPPLAVRALKSGLRTALDPDFDVLGAFVSTNLARLFATADHREGVAAFLEKRAANYIGS